MLLDRNGWLLRNHTCDSCMENTENMEHLLCHVHCQALMPEVIVTGDTGHIICVQVHFMVIP